MNCLFTRNGLEEKDSLDLGLIDLSFENVGGCIGKKGH